MGSGRIHSARTSTSRNLWPEVVEVNACIVAPKPLRLTCFFFLHVCTNSGKESRTGGACKSLCDAVASEDNESCLWRPHTGTRRALRPEIGNRVSLTQWQMSTDTKSNVSETEATAKLEGVKQNAISSTPTAIGAAPVTVEGFPGKEPVILFQTEGHVELVIRKCNMTDEFRKEDVDVVIEAGSVSLSLLIQQRSNTKHETVKSSFSHHRLNTIRVHGISPFCRNRSRSQQSHHFPR